MAVAGTPRGPPAAGPNGSGGARRQRVAAAGDEPPIVGQRIELDHRAAPLVVPGRILNELCSHAVETQPEECCGLVTGTETERFLSVYRCRNEMTLRHRQEPDLYPRDGRSAFYMSEVDLLKSQRDAESRGQKVTAVYHSHVGAGVYLSEMDLAYAEQELFPFPDAAQIVIAAWDRKVARVGVFERGAGGDFAGRPVVAETP